ncbi:MAG: hypothetical protein KJ709_01560 [Nanoarchaeota archaeon]|nr:hypothetical protein [Nanoarchaeota archaeon]
MKTHLLILATILLIACSQQEAGTTTVVDDDLPEIPKCPESCDDLDDCTRDHCSDSTDYVCAHDPQACCGDGNCDDGENKCTCPTDCGNCNSTMQAGLGWISFECVDETCEMVRHDASECDDDDSCTEDSFLDGCVHEVIEPCCGNNECEAGESCNDCSLDCECAITKDLADFPGIFGSDPLIVTGDQGVAADTLAATIIALAVGASGDAVLASEVSSVMGRDMIVIGSPCVNKVAYKLTGRPSPCDSEVSNFYADIKLVQTGQDSVALLVMSSQPELHRVAAQALTNGGLSGSSAQVSGTLESPVVS